MKEESERGRDGREEHALSKREILQIPQRKRIEVDNDDADAADDDNTLQVSRLPSNWGKCRLGSEEAAAWNFHVQALFAPAGLINRRGRNLKVRKTTSIFFRATSERAKFIKRLKHSCSWIAVKLNELSNCRMEK